MKKLNLILAACAVVLSTTAAMADELSDAFKACVNSSIVYKTGADGKIEGAELVIEKTAVQGTSDSILSIGCTGAKAEALFFAVSRFSTERDSVWSSGDRVLSRYFGDLGVASQCNRKIRNADGTEANYYWCILRFDIVGSMIKAMNVK